MIATYCEHCEKYLPLHCGALELCDCPKAKRIRAASAAARVVRSAAAIEALTAMGCPLIGEIADYEFRDCYPNELEALLAWARQLKGARSANK